MEGQKPTRQQREILGNLNQTLGAFQAQTPYADAQPATAAPLARRKNPRALIVAASRVRTDPNQVRQKDREPSSERIQELARSIQAVGLQQPPGVRETADGQYEVVYGEGRFVAMTAVLGWQEIEVIRVDAEEEDLIWHQLHENVHRTNLDPLDLAAAVAKAIEQNYTRAQVAERMAKSEAWVVKALAVATRLSDDARETLAESGERQAMDAVYAVAQVPTEKQAAVAMEVVEKKLSRRDAQKLAEAVRKEAARKEDPPARGRKKKTKAFETTLRASGGVTVTVSFRKAVAKPEEVVAALEEVLQALRENVERPAR